MARSVRYLPGSPQLMRVLPELGQSLVSWLSRKIGANADPDSDLRIVELAQRELIGRLPLGLAIFGRDRRLRFSNARFGECFGLSPTQLEEGPLFEETLDAARANRRIPEQRDFAEWKVAKLKLFDEPSRSLREIWSLPTGRVQRMTFLRNALDGLTVEIEDLTDKLELLTAYNSLQRVQKATLEAIAEGIAIFGPDGCLRVHNGAFRRILSLDEALLFSLPHVSKLSQVCAEQFRFDEMWSSILFAINSDAPVQTKASCTFTRANGRTMALSLTRLPDGGTIVRLDVAADNRLEFTSKGQTGE